MSSVESILAHFATAKPPYRIFCVRPSLHIKSVFTNVTSIKNCNKHSFLINADDDSIFSDNHQYIRLDESSAKYWLIYLPNDLPESIVTTHADAILRDTRRATHLYNDFDNYNRDIEMYNLMRTNVYGFIIRQWIIIQIYADKEWWNGFSKSYIASEKNTINLCFRSKFFVDRYPTTYYKYINSYQDDNKLNVQILLQSMRDYNQLSIVHKKATMECVKNITTVLYKYIPSNVITHIYNTHLFRFEYDDTTLS
jgi:hypothetical protein